MLRTIRVPWLHDRHSHVSFYAALSGCLSLADKSREDALAGLGALPEDRLSMVFGWHSAKLPFTLDELQPLPPAIIVNFSMHGFALSGAGERMLAETQPEMAANWRDPAWSERNLPRLLEIFSRTARLTPDKLDLFISRMEALGLGAVDDMLLPGDEALDVIRQSAWGGHVRCWASPETFRSLSPSSQEACAGLKFFTDGALGSRTAGLRGTFLGGQGGMLLHSDEQLFRMFGEAHPCGKPLAVHAIGDGAIEQVLTALERLERDGVRFPGVRLEHVQFIDQIQSRRAKDLGIVLSMQPNFNSDSEDYADRLGSHWLEINNPFRMLIDEAGFRPGEDLIFGSDGMPHGIEYALQWSLFPAYPGQGLTVDELVAGYGVSGAGKGESVLEVDDAERRVKLVESRKA